jgi:hypothetical protein
MEPGSPSFYDRLAAGIRPNTFAKNVTEAVGTRATNEKGSVLKSIIVSGHLQVDTATIRETSSAGIRCKIGINSLQIQPQNEIVAPG